MGVGPLFQLLYLSLQSAMPIEDMAASTGCLGLVRSIGGTVGVSVCGAIYGSRLRAGLSGVVGYEVPAGGANAAVNELNNIMECCFLFPLPLHHRALTLSLRVSHSSSDVKYSAPTAGLSTSPGSSQRHFSS